MFERNKTETSYTDTVEATVDEARRDMRAPGYYNTLSKAIYKHVQRGTRQQQETLHQEAGVSQRAPYDKRAAAVVASLAEDGRILLVFERRSDDDRPFVSGDCESDLQMVLVADGQDVLLCTGGMDRWDVQRLSAQHIEAMYTLQSQAIDMQAGREEEDEPAS
jgi:hypothetical protein